MSIRKHMPMVFVVAALATLTVPASAQRFRRFGGGIYSAFPSFYPTTFMGGTPNRPGYGAAYNITTYPAQVGPLAPQYAPNGYPYDPQSQQAADLADQTGHDAGVAVTDARPAAVPPPATNSRPKDQLFEAGIDKNNQFVVTYSGDQSPIASITVALLDKDRAVITQRMITGIPAQGKFTLTNKTNYYRITVRYVNGSSMSLVSPI